MLYSCQFNSHVMYIIYSTTKLFLSSISQTKTKSFLFFSLHWVTLFLFWVLVIFFSSLLKSVFPVCNDIKWTTKICIQWNRPNEHHRWEKRKKKNHFKIIHVNRKLYGKLTESPNYNMNIAYTLCICCHCARVLP